jgi:hypothetical protein
MTNSSKALLLILFTYLSFNVQCHELLIDFLDFQVRNSQVHLTETCADHLRLLKNGIERDEMWALKGKNQCDNSSATVFKIGKTF